MVLTERQRNELHSAVLQYLLAQDGKFSDTAAAFAREADISTDKAASQQNGTSSSSTPLLEKKWTSIVRLQKKVLSLESDVTQLERQVSIAAKGGGGGSGTGGGNGQLQTVTTFTLDPTPKHKLSGHRAPVLGLAFHPIYNLVVSVSEDASAKVWDYETGEFERTLKGHTGAVQSVAFSIDGTLLATCASDLSVKLWDTQTFECTRTLMGHDHNVTGVAFLPQSLQQIMATSISGLGYLRVIEVCANGKELSDACCALEVNVTDKPVL